MYTLPVSLYGPLVAYSSVFIVPTLTLGLGPHMCPMGHVPEISYGNFYGLFWGISRALFMRHFFRIFGSFFHLSFYEMVLPF